MSTRRRLETTAPLFALLLFAALSGCAPTEEAGPDLVLLEGVVRLGDLREPVEAIAIDGPRIVASGTVAEIRGMAVESTQEMTLEDSAVLPGLRDAWIDLEAVGRWESGLDLRTAVSPREVQAILRSATPDRGWIVGWGWDETLWPEPVLPDRSSLDAVGDRPILLYRRIGAVGWANTAALNAAGLGDSGPPGLRTGTDGEPTGIVTREALGRIEAAMPQPTERQRREWLEAGARAAAAAGITGVATTPLDTVALELLRDLDSTGDLSVRVHARLRPEASVGLRADTSPPADGLVSLRGLGLVVDGPFRPPLAHTREPYGGGVAPAPYADRATVAAACAAAEQLGLRLDVRAHGDAAVEMALAACPQLASGEGWIVGADLPPQGLLESEASVVALPLRMTHDLYWLEEDLGAERGARAHPFRALLGAGRLRAVASAGPAHDLDTPGWMRAFSARRDADGYPLDGWQPGQRISVGDTLRLATRPLADRTDDGGPLADLVVWSSDPLGADIEPASVRPLVTIVGGRVIYSRPLMDVPFDME